MIFRVVTAPLRFSSIWACAAVVVWMSFGLALALPAAAAAAPTRKVLIETDPPGASVYVGEKEAGSAGVTPVVVEMPLGDNVIIIELDGHVPKFETLSVPKGKPNAKQIKVSYKLEAGRGAIVVTIDAAGKGAKVLVDGQEQGTAPGRIEVPAGSRRVEVVNKGKTIYDDTVMVSSGGEASVNARSTAKVAVASGKDGKGKDGKPGKGKDVSKPGKPVVKPADVDDDRPLFQNEPIDEPPRQADPVEVAVRDPEPPEAPPADKLEVREKSERPSGPTKPARRWLKVSPLVEVGYRNFDYEAIDSMGNLPALRQRGAILFGLRVEAQPLAALPGLSISAEGGYGLPQTLETSQGDADSTWWRGEAELSYRLRLGSSWSLLALAGYGMSRFQFVGPTAAYALVPAATYGVVRLGAGVGYRTSWLDVVLQVENRPVLSGGAFADRFDTASADGLAARLAALAFLSERFFARLEGNFARYSWSLTYALDDTYRARGAQDVQFGFGLSTGMTF